MQYIKDAKNVVCIIGAGMSTASGIPDFNGPKGLYSMPYKGYAPESILSKETLRYNPKLFYDFLRDKLLNYEAQPNAGHYALKELADMGKVKAVVSQNIDNLEFKAEIPNTYQVHGTLAKFHCVRCGLPYTKEEITNMMDSDANDGLPRCLHCGKVIRPNIVLYGESLDADVTNEALCAIDQSDLALVIGTSFNVFPVAYYLDNYEGKIVVINQGETRLDARCDLKIEEPAEEYLPKLVAYLKSQKQQ